MMIQKVGTFFLLFFSCTSVGVLGRVAYADSSTSTFIRCESQQAVAIDQKLACLPGVLVNEITSKTSPAGTRQFDIQFEQKIDHFSKSSGSFWQRLVLTHRREFEPVVLQTSGYSIFGVKETSITKMFQTNQLQIEHRYFSGSIPSVLDWTKLDIEQSANDFHRIKMVFQEIYPGPWINTGASKGGMTSIFHRRFYPDDVVGTIADVAPLSFGPEDDRYISFLEQVGGKRFESCRAQLSVLQRSLLQNRDFILPQIQGQYDTLGGAEVAFEHAVSELPFVFWQYGDPESLTEGCAAIPSVGTASEQLDFLNLHSPIEGYEDSQLIPFQPYFVQAATQLGGPATDRRHLTSFLKFPMLLDQYLPKGVSFRFDPSAMLDIQDWVKNQADDLILVYGEFDPWTAGAFPQSNSGQTVQRFIQPGGNHSAKFVTLEDADRTQVVGLLSGWLQKNPVVSHLKIRKTLDESLESLELKVRRKYRLR